MGTQPTGGGFTRETVPLLVQQRLGTDQDSGGAEAALQRPRCRKCAGEPFPLGLIEALEGGHPLPLRSVEPHQAALNGFPVEQHRAGSALPRGSAPVFWGGDVQFLAQG